jgi:hypothetical protein
MSFAAEPLASIAARVSQAVVAQPGPVDRSTNRLALQNPWVCSGRGRIGTRSVPLTDGYCNKSIMLGRGPAPGVELRVAIQVVRRRLGDEFREPAESELSAGVTSPPVSGVRGLPLTPDDFLR